MDFSAKVKALNALSQADWNRYPAADVSQVEQQVAKYCGLQPDNIVLGAGSASIITTLLNYFGINRKQIHIVQPSYSLFDYHCKSYNIPYQPWMLTEGLDYDLDKLPEMDENSVLILTTPNNPTGNAIAPEDLVYILEANPRSLIVVDAVYEEFAEKAFTQLVNRYENLLVIRSFSKAFPVAGLRLGYLCAAPKMAAMIKKLVLPFSLNVFTLAFAQEILFEPNFIENAQKTIDEIIAEREKLYASLKAKIRPEVLHVFKSQGNFLLVRVQQDEDFEQLMQDLGSQGIKVLNTSPFPLLKNTFRVSIGSPDENLAFLQCALQCLQPKQSQLEKLKGSFVKLGEGSKNDYGHICLS